MTDHDSMRDLLREWKAPEPPAALDARMRKAYRAAYRMRISLPVPVFAAAVLLGLASLLEFRFRPAPVPVPPRAEPEYVTRLYATGFQPLPNGAARVVLAGGR